ncbi:MAG: hypothetical protein LAN62_07555 [Acidobacteriia bacterium]|nr:hypothetical protein [Terriglobia bacterium]
MPASAAAVAGGVGTVLLGAALAGGALIYDMGGVWVSVKAKKPGGDNIRLVVPAAAGPVALWLAPKKNIREAAKEARPWLPAIKAAAEELGNCPDGPLVEVTNPHEKVLIAKQGGALVIDVDNPNETVHVSVPLKMVGIIAAQLEAMPDAEAAHGNAVEASESW